MIVNTLPSFKEIYKFDFGGRSLYQCAIYIAGYVLMMFMYISDIQLDKVPKKYYTVYHKTVRWTLYSLLYGVYGFFLLKAVLGILAIILHPLLPVIEKFLDFFLKRYSLG